MVDPKFIGKTYGPAKYEVGIEKVKGVRATDEQVARLVAKAREVLAKA